jgi:hypothetical protein
MRPSFADIPCTSMSSEAVPVRVVPSGGLTHGLVDILLLAILPR